MMTYDFARRRRKRARIGRKRARRRFDFARPRRRRRARARTRQRRRYDFAPRFRRFRRRRYDIPGTRSPLMGALLQPIFTTIGAWAHNWLVNRKGILAGSFQVGNVAVISHAGILGGMIGAILDFAMPNKTHGAIANAIGSGFMAEGVNVPMMEGVATPQAIQKATGQQAVPNDSYMPVAM